MLPLVTHRFGLTIITTVADSYYNSFRHYSNFKITLKGNLLGYWNFGGDNYRDILATKLNPKMQLVRRGDNILIFKQITK